MRSPLDSYFEELHDRLRERRRDGLNRELEPAHGIDFTSNDYLGLSRHPRLLRHLSEILQECPAGAPASRLLRGNHPIHEEAEGRFAEFKGTEAALLFPSGYQANAGALTALIGRHDRVLSDEWNHASLIDGMRLTGAERVIYPHLDLDAVETHLRRPHPGGRTFVVTESLFSMDGDIAALDELVRLTHRHGALLMVDEAHATGLFGDTRGSGLVEFFAVERDVLATTSSCGKALGLSGAFVTGSRIVKDHLVNHARSFVFTTAPSPLLAATVCESLRIANEEPWRRERALRNADRLRERLRALDVPGSSPPEAGEARTPSGPIIPIPIGDNRLSVEIATRIRGTGYDVRTLRPPTVPDGTARLRVSVHADHHDEDIDGVAEAIARAIAPCRAEIGGSIS